MKAIRLILVFITSLLFQYSYGDMIPVNYHRLDKCIKITNIDDFENLTLLGIISHGGSISDVYKISSLDCLYKGYKFNWFSICAVNSQYIKGKKLDSLIYSRDTNLLGCISSSSLNPFDPCADYVHDSIPITAVDQFFRVMGFTADNCILHKWKEVINYNNGLADSIFTYEYEGDTTELLKSFPLTSINSYNIDKSVSIFPNPTSDFLNSKVINNYTGRLEIEVYKTNGELLKEYKYYKRNFESYYRIPTSNISKGIYLVKFRFGDLIETKRVIIY